MDCLGPGALAAELWAGKRSLPKKLHTRERGVYALWLDENAFATLQLAPGRDGVAYVGIGDGGQGLAGRYAQEWRPKNSGRSSPRRTLGALLIDELVLVPRPRPGANHPRNAKYYVFGSEGERALTSWLDAHAEFAFVEIPDQELQEGESLAQVEQDLIQHLEPPINISKWRNPERTRLLQARKAAAEAAAKWSS